MTNKTVRCFGLNSEGQLGNGTTTSTSVPTPVLGLNDVKEIKLSQGDTAATNENSPFACALTASSQLFCWGSNAYGQMGQGSLAQTIYTSPVQVPLSNVSAFDLGRTHACAVSGSRLYCWGDNRSGQLLNGTRTSVLSPTLTTINGTVVSVGAAAQASCAIMNTGQVLCSGNNIYGQLGTAPNLFDFLTTTLNPTPTNPLTSKPSVIDGGASHFCALFPAEGLQKVQCVGYGAFGQIGDGANTLSSGNYEVSLNANHASQISVGLQSSCFIKKSPIAAAIAGCYGDGSFGQLGNGSSANRNEFTPVIDVVDPTFISIGNTHGCVVQADTTAKCFGSNTSGERGDNLAVQSGTPSYVYGSECLTDAETCSSPTVTPSINCTNQAVSWSQNGLQCQATTGANSNGTTRNLTNTSGGFVGSATATCNSSTDTYSLSNTSCSTSACTARTITWAGSGASCSASVGSTSNGGTRNLTSSNGNPGSATAVCNSSTNSYSLSGTSCSNQAPPPTDTGCTSRSVTWSANGNTCSSSLPSASSGTFNALASNTATSGSSHKSGSANYSCINGNWIPTPNSTPTCFRGCNIQFKEDWSGTFGNSRDLNLPRCATHSPQDQTRNFSSQFMKHGERRDVHLDYQNGGDHPDFICDNGRATISNRSGYSCTKPNLRRSCVAHRRGYTKQASCSYPIPAMSHGENLRVIASPISSANGNGYADFYCHDGYVQLTDNNYTCTPP